MKLYRSTLSLTLCKTLFRSIGLLVDVAEVVCGDPSCAPIDTVFTLVWQSGGKGVFALPMLAAEVTKEDLIDAFPVSSFLFWLRRLTSYDRNSFVPG